jgi:hypothetical protein
VRAFGIEKDLGSMPLDEFIGAIGEEYRTKGRSTVRQRFEAVKA